METRKTYIIDVSGLSYEETKVIEELVDLFKQRAVASKSEGVKQEHENSMCFGAFHIYVQGSITRGDIYDTYKKIYLLDTNIYIYDKNHFSKFEEIEVLTP